MRAASLKQIADALGRTRTTVLRRANRDGWPFETAAGRGGERRLYLMDALPAEVRDALVASTPKPAQQQVRSQARQAGAALGRAATGGREVADQVRRADKEDGLKRFAALPSDSPRRLRAQAREAVLRALWDLRRQRSLAWRAAFEICARLVNTGELALPDWAWDWMPQRHGARAVTAASIRRWHYDYQCEGIAGLVDGYGTRKGAFKVAEHPELKEVVIGCLMQAPHIKPRDIKAYLQARHPDLDISSEKAIERFIKHWKRDNAQVWTQLTNPDAWKNKFMTAHGSHHEHITRLNQLWELDSTPADWMLADGRHSVVGVIDMHTRRLRLLVSKTSTANAIGLLFRRAAMEWGVPEAVRTDNGADYVSRHFASVVSALEIDHQVCMPFASEQKGTIERALQTMSHGILDLLPGFIGHNVAERKVIEARRSFADRIMTRGETVEVSMSAKDLQQKLDQWCDHVYMHNHHAGLRCTPFEKVSQCRDRVRRIQDERALDALLMEIGGLRTVTKKGIKFEHHCYIAPELAAQVGEEVFLRRDPDDIGSLFVYDLDGRFVCVARAHEILGISRAEAAAAARHHQKRFLAEQKEALAGARRAVRENIAEAVLNHRMDQTANLTRLPSPAEPYTTAALDQAALAAGARRGEPAPAPHSAETDDAVARLAAEMSAPAPAAVMAFSDPMQEYAYWCRLDARRQAGQALGQRERSFYESYATTPDYQRMHRYFEEFGLDALEYGA